MAGQRDIQTHTVLYCKPIYENQSNIFKERNGLCKDELKLQSIAPITDNEQESEA